MAKTSDTPKFKTVYSFNPETFEYVGEAIADECPIEKGTYHLPASTTATPPPEYKAGKIRIYDHKKNKWSQIDIVTQTDALPEKTKEQLLSEARANRNRTLLNTDYLMLPDMFGALSDTEKKALVEFRQLLRDLPKKKDFIDFSKWPVNPLSK